MYLNILDRYYLNQFRDAYRQAAIDVMTGQALSESLLAAAHSAGDEEDDDDEEVAAQQACSIGQLVNYNYLSIKSKREKN